MRKWKTLFPCLLILVLICVLLPIPTHAVGTCGENATWYIYQGRMTISGTGQISVTDSAPWNSARNTVREVVIEPGITAIAAETFRNFVAMTTVTLPDGLEIIGDYAFSGCGMLQNITLPESVEIIGANAFSGCTKLSQLNLPAGITGIGASAFARTRLTSMTLPESITVIPDSLFSGCTKLEQVTLSPNTTAIGKYAFLDCSQLTEIHLPTSLQRIDDAAFHGCRRLEAVYIEDLHHWFTVEFYDNPLENQAKLFVDGIQLTELVAPDGITHVPTRSFAGCVGLVRVTIPNTVTSIGSKAFSTCPDLTTIYLTSSLQSLTGFENCPRIQKVYYDGSLQQFQEYKIGAEFANAELFLTTQGTADTLLQFSKSLSKLMEELTELFHTWKPQLINLLLFGVTLDVVLLAVVLGIVFLIRRKARQHKVKKRLNQKYPK